MHKKKPPVFVCIRVVTLVISLVRFGCGKTAVTDGEKKNQASWRPLRTQPGIRARSRRAVQFDVAPGGEFYLAIRVRPARRNLVNIAHPSHESTHAETARAAERRAWVWVPLR